jgi:hypothetical protein
MRTVETALVWAFVVGVALAFWFAIGAVVLELLEAVNGAFA